MLWAPKARLLGFAGAFAAGFAGGLVMGGRIRGRHPGLGF